MISKFVLAAAIGLCLMSEANAQCPNNITTCDSTDDNPTYKLCFYDKHYARLDQGTPLLVTAIKAISTIFHTDTTCYCQNACNPSQLVCDDANPQNSPLIVMGSNGLVRVLYAAEFYYVHCYCPDCYPPGVNPCAYPTFPFGEDCKK